MYSGHNNLALNYVLLLFFGSCKETITEYLLCVYEAWYIHNISVNHDFV